MRKIVKFYFNTNLGPGTMTVSMGENQTLENTKKILLDSLSDYYTEIEVVDHEIIELN